MEQVRRVPIRWVEAGTLVAGVILLAIIGWPSDPSRYLIAHTLAELFVIIVAVTTATVVWNSAEVVENGYLTVLAIAGLFVAGIDFVHALTFKGMTLLPIRGADIPTQLWLAGRYLQAGSILVAAAFICRRVRIRNVALVSFGVAAALLASVLWFDVFPAAFVEGVGLTPFKIWSEYVVVIVMAAGLGLLIARRKAFERDVFFYLAAFIGFSMLAEFSFTAYVSVYAHANLVGHLLRVFAAYSLYRAIVVTAISRPYDLLFRELKQKEAALAESERRFRATFEEAGVGIGLVGLDERLFSVNDRLAEIAGRTRAEMQSLTPERIAHPEDFEKERPLIAELLSGDRPSYTVEKRYILPDRSTRWVSATRTLLRDDAGEARYFVVVVEDVQARRESEERLRHAKELSDALNVIDAAMNSSLDAETIMREVVERGADALGVEAVRLSFREGDRWVARYVRHPGHDVHAGDVMTDDEMPLTLIVERTQQPLIVQDSSAEAVLPGAERLRELDIASYVGVPLVFKDEVIGVLTFAKMGEPAPFTHEQVDFATRLATSLSLALENARLYAVEHRIADTLQEALLSPPPQMAGLELSHLYRSATELARVGGDFYDVFEVAPDVVGIIVGDVSGKGIEAAALTTVVKTAVKANAAIGGTPAEVMSRVNDFLVRQTSDSAFVTAFYGTLDLRTGSLDYCSGGHPPAVLKRAQGVSGQLATSSPIIGAFEEVTYTDEIETMAPGDVLVLYTDGVIECRGPDGQFGDERLLGVVSSFDGDPAGLPSYVLESVQGFCAGVLSDDIAVVAIARV